MFVKPTILFCVCISSLGYNALGQSMADTLQGQSDADVVVTATRTERKLSNVAVPTLLISQQQIQATQVRRLNELLQEQTGIFVTNGSGSGGFGGGIFGNGAQLQGMSPEYTLVLINGEPIVGRQGGTLNLSRLSVSNIRKVEIVKGPASSLYGSEAMGGVINIITDLPVQPEWSANMKAGGYGLLDANLSGTWVGRNSRVHAAYNGFRMGGIDFDNNQYGRQQDPFHNHTAQLQWQQQLAARWKLLVYGRYFYEQARNAYEVADANLNSVRIGGDTRVEDANLNASLVFKANSRIQSSLRLYGTAYQSLQQLQLEKDGSSYYYDRFRQQFYRAENQTDIKLSEQHLLTAGAGAVYEQLNTTRYAGQRTNTIVYGFVQDEWKPRSNLNIIGGLRYDNNQAYASRLSPKLAIRYSPSGRLKLTASYGAGFKAPDFRQLYLSFINNASAGYALFGANEISLQRLLELQQQGFISNILPRANDLAELKPETSHGFNAGAAYQVSKTVHADVNLFFNSLSNQILFDAIALRPNGSQVFSYFNIARSYTTGAEANVQWQALTALQVSAGYQLVLTGDKSVREQIKAGQIYGRQPGTNAVYQLQMSDYYGLPGRSRHMANLKLLYHTGPWQATLRAVYRNAWGTFDQDGNGMINRSDEKANGFVLLNANISRSIHTRWRVSAGAENLLNHRDAMNLPNIPGINAYASVSYQWTKNKTQ